MTEVKVGQTWVDCDKRMGGRTLYIDMIDISFEGRHSLRPTNYFAHCRVVASGQYTRIRIDRFNTSAFRLLHDENGKRVDESR